MMNVRREGHVYEAQLEQACDAPAEAVYDLLADLPTHLNWGGDAHARAVQHLVSMEVPDRAATVGTTFDSVGQTRGGTWHDSSTVTRAERPHVFEFETRGVLRDAEGFDRLLGHWMHTYALTEDGVGCVIRYQCHARLKPTLPAGAHHEHHHPRLPVVIYNLMIPMVMERGLQNLAAMAEARALIER